MTVHCAHCGEKLLGAVNRCWRCGRHFLSGPEVSGEPLEAEIVRPLQAELVGAAADLPQSAPPPVRAAQGVVPPAAHLARRPGPSAQRQYTASTGGAIASVVLGILSLLGLFFPFGALLIALLGLAMGVWGLFSKQRATAIAGLMLCCIALAVASFLTAVELYTAIYGFSPWEAAEPREWE